MSSAGQLLFPFPSLDFEGRTALYPHEVALKLGFSTDHIYDLCEEGCLTAIDGASKGASRRELRIPIESYRTFILERMTGPMRAEFMRALPEAALRALAREIALMIPLYNRRELLRELLQTAA